VNGADQPESGPLRFAAGMPEANDPAIPEAAMTIAAERSYRPLASKTTGSGLVCPSRWRRESMPSWSLTSAIASSSGIRQMSRRLLETSMPTTRRVLLGFVVLMRPLPFLFSYVRPCRHGLASKARGSGNRSDSTSFEGGRDDPYFLRSPNYQIGTGLPRPSCPIKEALLEAGSP
jgi:hypothetical protein